MTARDSWTSQKILAKTSQQVVVPLQHNYLCLCQLFLQMQDPSVH